LMHVASRANDALAKLNRDLQAGGFGANSRGLARDLYTSFTATIAGVKGTEDEAIAWAIGRALAIDLDGIGARRGALALLDGLIAFGTSNAGPPILARLRQTEEAIDQKMGRRRRGVGKTRKVSDHPAAGQTPSVQGPPLHQADGEPSSPEPPAFEPDVAGGPEKQLRVAVSAPSGEPSLQFLSNAAGKASETGPAIVPDRAETTCSPLNRMDEAAHAVRSAVAEEPKPIAPALQTESPAPGPVTPLTARPRSRRGGEFLLGTVTAMAGVVLYLQMSHDGSLWQHPLTIVTGTATSPIGASGVNSASTNPFPGDATTSAAAAPASAGTDADALSNSQPPSNPFLPAVPLTRLPAPTADTPTPMINLPAVPAPPLSRLPVATADTPTPMIDLPAALPVPLIRPPAPAADTPTPMIDLPAALPVPLIRPPAPTADTPTPMLNLPAAPDGQAAALPPADPVNDPASCNPNCVPLAFTGPAADSLIQILRQHADGGDVRSASADPAGRTSGGSTSGGSTSGGSGTGEGNGNGNGGGGGSAGGSGTGEGNGNGNGSGGGSAGGSGNGNGNGNGRGHGNGGGHGKGH
jgi:hypothetical protein